MTDNKKEESPREDHKLGTFLAKATVIILFISMVIWAYYGLYQGNMETAAQYGDFFGGFAGALAFFFLIYSIDLQRRELTLQRDELRAQREQLEMANAESKAQREVMQAQYQIMQMEAQERARTLYSEAIQQAVDGFKDKDEWVRDLDKMKRIMHALSKAQKLEGAESQAHSILALMHKYMQFFEILAEETRKYANRIGIELINSNKNDAITFLNKNKKILLSMPVTLSFRNYLMASLSLLPEDPETLLLTYASWFAFQLRGESSVPIPEMRQRIIDYIAAHGLPRDDMLPWFEYLQSPRMDDIPPPEF